MTRLYVTPDPVGDAPRLVRLIQCAMAWGMPIMFGLLLVFYVTFGLHPFGSDNIWYLPAALSLLHRGDLTLDTAPAYRP